MEKQYVIVEKRLDQKFAFYCKDGTFRSVETLREWSQKENFEYIRFVRTYNSPADAQNAIRKLPTRALVQIKRLSESLFSLQESKPETQRVFSSTYMFDEQFVQEENLSIEERKVEEQSEFIKEMVQAFETIQRFKVQWLERANVLKNGIKEADAKTLDLLHEIELKSFNASDGFKISKRLQEIRKQRRLYKDDFLVMQAFHKLIMALETEDIDKALQTVRDMNCRVYKNRCKDTEEEL